MTIRYAAYGSNLHPLRLAARAPSARLLGTGRVPGWTVMFNKRSDRDGSAKCSITQSAADLFVAVYEMSAADKRALDRIEGLGAGYDEHLLEPTGFGRCVTYRASRSHECYDRLPYDWYREMVVIGCAALNMPAAYAAGIAAVRAVVDPDEARRRDQWRVVMRLRRAAQRTIEAAT